MPTTPSRVAILTTVSLSRSMVASESEYGGITAVESPEWTPAGSMCCITPPIQTSSPSARQSMSTSMAFSRKRSSRIWLSGNRVRMLATYSATSSLLIAIRMPCPPSTYEGRIRIG